MNEMQTETTLAQLRPGAVFVTRENVYAVKSEYRRDDLLQWECVLLESGEYAWFKDGDQTIVREVQVEDLRQMSDKNILSKEFEDMLIESNRRLREADRAEMFPQQSEHTDQDTRYPVLLSVEDMHLIAAGLRFIKATQDIAHDHAEQLETLMDTTAKEKYMKEMEA